MNEEERFKKLYALADEGLATDSKHKDKLEKIMADAADVMFKEEGIDLGRKALTNALAGVSAEMNVDTLKGLIAGLGVAKVIQERGGEVDFNMMSMELLSIRLLNEAKSLEKVATAPVV